MSGDSHSNPARASRSLDVGANLGACTVQMLSLSSASVVAVEPSPVNLFHLTRSLQLAASAQGGIASRVTVLPVAVGDAAQRREMFYEKGNHGDTRMAEVDGSNKTTATLFEHLTDSPVEVHQLDDLLKLSMASHDSPRAHVPLMKVDTQGFECRALKGSLVLLTSGAVESVVCELSKAMLRQLCAPEQVKEVLRLAGFSIVSVGRAKGISWEANMVARRNP